MGVTIKEIKRKLEEFSDRQTHIDFLQEQNERLRKRLKTVSECREREAVELEIRANEHSLIWRVKEQAAFLGIMDKNLTRAEIEILRLRHIENNKWDFIVYKMNLSRSNCIRIENRGMEKLRWAWEKHLEEEQRKNGGE